MATFNPDIRTNKEFNTVYIRISHNTKAEYIKTSMTVHKSSIRKGKITNPEILASCAVYPASLNILKIVRVPAGKGC